MRGQSIPGRDFARAAVPTKPRNFSVVGITATVVDPTPPTPLSPQSLHRPLVVGGDGGGGGSGSSSSSSYRVSKPRPSHSPYLTSLNESSASLNIALLSS